MMMMIFSIFFMSNTFDKIYYISLIAMVARVTGHIRLDKRYFKKLSFIQVALTGLCLNSG